MPAREDSETTARRWGLLGLEAACAFGVAIAFTLLCRHIQVNPMERMGQVSALASMQVRFMLLAAPIVVALLVGARYRGGVHFAMVSRFACAAASGLASGMLAGGILVALRGTSFGLNAQFGDSAVLANWTDEVIAGHGMPTPYYPPAQIYMLAAISQLQGVAPVFGLKLFNTIGILSIGPSAYVAWRLWLRPTWALGVGGICALPMMEAYRPYPLLILVIFVPVIARFLHTLRRSDEYDVMELARRGLAYGVVLAVLFLIYSGWFHWSAPGVMIAAVAVFPYRRAPRRGALLCAVAGLVFAVIAGHYILGVLHAPPIADDFHYFDSKSDPAYITMWRGDTPGPFGHLGEWPPTGELGGVGVFTLLLAVGAAAALALGRTHSLIVGLGALLASSWFLRFWTAHHMWKTKLVQLYPRTTAQILHCLMVAAALAVMWWIARVRARAPADSPLRTPWGHVAAMLGIMFVFSQAGSFLSDRYMPNPTHGFHGEYAYMSQRAQQGLSQARQAQVVTSSEGPGDHVHEYVTDEQFGTFFSSALHPTPFADEWIEIKLPLVYEWQFMAITAGDDGWPTDFVVELWDGQGWVQRYRGVDVTRPVAGDKLYLYWGRWEATPRVRLRATRLGSVPGGFALRIGEIELFQ